MTPAMQSGWAPKTLNVTAARKANGDQANFRFSFTVLRHPPRGETRRGGGRGTQLESKTSLTPYWPVVSIRSSEKAIPGCNPVRNARSVSRRPRVGKERESWAGATKRDGRGRLRRRQRPSLGSLCSCTRLSSRTGRRAPSEDSAERGSWSARTQGRASGGWMSGGQGRTARRSWMMPAPGLPSRW